MPVRHRLRTLVLGVALATAAVFGIAAPASAHDALTGSEPASGATVSADLTQVTLQFSADLMADGAEAHVYQGADPKVAADAGATDWVSGAVAIDGPNLVVPLAEGLEPGTYSVSWRVVSSDGHPIDSSTAEIITFTVAAAPEAIQTPTAEASPVPTTTSAPASPQVTTPASEATPEATADAADSTEGLSPVVVWTLIGGGLVVVVLIATIVLVSRRKKP